MILDFQILKSKFEEILLKYGFPHNQAAAIAKVFAETSIDGVFSYGINRFPRSGNWNGTRDQKLIFLNMGGIT